MHIEYGIQYILNYLNTQLYEPSIIWTRLWFDCACAGVMLSQWIKFLRSAKKAKQRKVTLTIDEKLEIIEFVDAGSSCTVRAGKYSTYMYIAQKSTVANIKKDASKFEAYKKSIEISFRKATSKVMTTGKYKKIDEALCMYKYVYWECFVLDMWANNFKFSTESVNKLLTSSLIWTNSLIWTFIFLWEDSKRQTVGLSQSRSSSTIGLLINYFMLDRTASSSAMYFSVFSVDLLLQLRWAWSTRFRLDVSTFLGLLQ